MRETRVNFYSNWKSCSGVLTSLIAFVNSCSILLFDRTLSVQRSISSWPGIFVMLFTLFFFLILCSFGKQENTSNFKELFWLTHSLHSPQSGRIDFISTQVQREIQVSLVNTLLFICRSQISVNKNITLLINSNLTRLVENIQKKISRKLQQIQIIKKKIFNKEKNKSKFRKVKKR